MSDFRGAVAKVEGEKIKIYLILKVEVISRRVLLPRPLPSDVHASGSHECRALSSSGQPGHRGASPSGGSPLAMLCTSEHPEMGSVGADVLLQAKFIHYR